MALPIKWRSKILLAKIETTYGTDAVPTGGANGILAVEVVWTPMEGTDVPRDLETPWLGADEMLPAELHAKLAFKVELAPSGTRGTVPAWGVLLRGCAVAQVITAATSVICNPVSDNHESLTFWLWIGGTRYVMSGARGNCRFTVNTQGIPYLEFEFTGLYSAPSEQTRLTPTLTAFQKPRIASNASTPVFTVGDVPLVLRSFVLNLGNQVEPRFLIGSERVIIPDRTDSVEMTVEAVPLSVLDPFALARDQTSVELVLTHGTDAGRIATITVPRMQMMRPQGLANAQNIKEWTLRGVPLPGTGNDQWTLSLT